MAKDIAKLREEEAEKERERIASLKPSEKTFQEKSEAREFPRPQTQQEPVDRPSVDRPSVDRPTAAIPAKDLRMPVPSARTGERTAFPEGLPIEEPRPWPKMPLPPPPSLSDHLTVKLGLVIIVILVFTNLFLFWKWYLKDDWLKGRAGISMPPPSEQPPSEQPPTEIPPEILPGPVISPSLILVQATTTLEIASTTELTESFASELKKDFPQASFTRLLIKNKTEEKYLGLKDFLGHFTTTSLEGFYQKLEPDFTLFIYSQKQGNRPGFVSKIIAKEALAGFLLAWQKTMEIDLEQFYLLLDKKGPTLSPYFRKTYYKGAEIYYQTFSHDDLGICYALLDNYFILTTSWEGLLRTIDKL